MDWRYSQASAPLALTFSLVDPPRSPLPCVNKYRGIYLCIKCVTGGGGGGESGCVECIFMIIQCVFDQISNLQNCFTTPNKTLGGGEGPSDR
jgi:hypothetical protein